MRLRTLAAALSFAATMAAGATGPTVHAAGAEAWTSGPYAYDGAGNISKIGGNTYKYDSARRVREYLSEAGGSHAFSYDSFGNVKRIEIALPGGGTPITRVIPIESSSNQVAPSGGSVYDRAGNMLSYSGDIYKYDSQNMVVALEGVGKKLAYVYTSEDERIGTFNALTVSRN